MHVYKNEHDWFVAEDIAHAQRLAREHYEMLGYDESEIDLIFVQEPDDKPLTIQNDDGENERIRTCAQWAINDKPGHLCSTEW